MSLDDNSIVVLTGAASGIGRALAVRLASEGVNGLAIADVDPDGLNETARLIATRSARVTKHVVNVADPGQMRRFVVEVVAAHGGATHLINNAGVSLFGTVEEVSIEDIEWLMGVNFWGTVYGVKLFLPILREHAASHIVNVSSVFGIIAPPGNAAYCASKFAVRGFTEALRHELADTGITVSCVHPGGVATNIARGGRLGAHADGSVKDEFVKLHTRLSRTTPEAAAATILRGIKRRSKRILIGADARLIDLIQRAAPVGYMNAINPLFNAPPAKPRKKS